MQQLMFKLFVAIHGQDQFAGGGNGASGVFNRCSAKCLDLPEAPKRRTFCCGTPREALSGSVVRE